MSVISSPVQSLILLLMLLLPALAQASFRHELVNLTQTTLSGTCVQAVNTYFSRRYVGSGTVVVDAPRVMGAQPRLSRALIKLGLDDHARAHLLQTQKEIYLHTGFSVSPLTSRVFKRWRGRTAHPEAIFSFVEGSFVLPNGKPPTPEFHDLDTLFEEAEVVTVADDALYFSNNDMPSLDDLYDQKSAPNVMTVPVSNYFPKLRKGAKRAHHVGRKGAKSFWIGAAHEARHHEDWLIARGWVNANKRLKEMGFEADPMYRRYVRDGSNPPRIDRGFLHLFMESNAWFTDLEVELILDGKRGQIFEPHFEWARRNQMSQVFASAETGGYPRSLIVAYDELKYSGAFTEDPQNFDPLCVGQILRNRMVETIRLYAHEYRRRHGDSPPEIADLDLTTWDVPRRE